jgi:hypothetical protein
MPSHEMPNLDALAEAVGIKPELLRDISRRLAEDSQVQMIRALYQFETSEVGEALLEEGAKEPSPGATAALSELRSALVISPEPPQAAPSSPAQEPPSKTS